MPEPESEEFPSLEERLERLERRLEELSHRLEEVAQQSRPAAPTKPVPPSPQPGDIAETLAKQPAIPPPPVVPSLSNEVVQRLTAAGTAETLPPPAAAPPPVSTTRAAEPNTSNYWEQLAGGKGALWLGSVATFFALAFFLAYAWQLLGDVARLAVGFAIGAILLAIGEYSRRRVERWFSEGVCGAGVAVFYLSIWAGSERYQLYSFEVAFVLMAATVFLGVLLALRYDAISLSLLATTGGFLAPVLLQSEGSGTVSPHPLLSYITVLNAGLVTVSLYRQWRALAWLSFVATILVVVGWADAHYRAEMRWAVFSYVKVNFVLFLGCACFRSLVQRANTEPSDLLLIFADAGVYALAGYALIGDALGGYPSALALQIVALFGALNYAAHRLVPQNRNLQDTLAGIALLFLTIAVPMQLKQDWLVVGWAVQAAVLVALGARLNSELLYRAGQIVWGIALLALAAVVVSVEPERRLLFLNERALPLLTTVIASGAIAAYARKAPVRDDLAAVYECAAVLGGAWLLAQETVLGVQWSARRITSDWTSVAVYAAAIVWAVYAPLVYLLGARLRAMAVRFCALLVSTVAAVLPLWGALAMPEDLWTPFLNIRWLSAIVVSVLLAGLAWMAAREARDATIEEAEAVGLLTVLVSLVVLVALSAEVYFGFRAWRMPVDTQWMTALWFFLVAIWSLFAALFVTLGVLWNVGGLRVLGYAVGSLALIVLVSQALFTLPGTDLSVAWAPLLNLRALAFAVSVLALVWIALMLARYGSHGTPTEVALTGGIVAMATAVLLWGITQETYEAFYYWHETGRVRGDWQRVAQMAISLLWTLFGAAMLVAGILRSVQPARLAALGLLGFTALKVFVYDLSFLDTPMRILSFGGLGVTLIGISWLYSRIGIGRSEQAGNH